MKNIEYKFKNTALLKEALTHASYTNENKFKTKNEKSKPKCNERLEFLGDSVLQLITAKFLFKTYRKLPEGQLTKMRAALVCEKSLFEFAKIIDIGSDLFLGHGEETNGGRERPALLADAFEALIAAIYLDSGFLEAEKFVLSFFDQKKNEIDLKDYKTFLQEVVQRNPEEKLEYVLIADTGPAHDKTFDVEVRLNSNTIGRGSAHTKKNAEQIAAKEALTLMGIKH